MDDTDKMTGCIMAGMVAALLAIVGGFAWISAANESKVYNRLTGAHTTTWDALWVELRVQEGTQR